MSAAQRTEMNQRMDQMNQLITVLQSAMTDATQEIVNLRTTVSDTSNMTINLKNTSDAVWTSQAAKINDVGRRWSQFQNFRDIDTGQSNTLVNAKTQRGKPRRKEQRIFKVLTKNKNLSLRLSV